MEKPASTFICATCQRHEVVPYAPGTAAAKNYVPEGWDIEGATALCPDCVAASVTIADFNDVPTIFASDRDTFTLRADLPPEPPFTIGLDCSGQPDRCAIVLSPARVMTLYQPLAYLLDADEAMELAAELLRHATMARRAGTMGTAA